MKKCFFCLIAVFAIVLTPTACSTPPLKADQPAPAPVVSVLPSPVTAESLPPVPASAAAETPATVPASVSSQTPVPVAEILISLPPSSPPPSLPPSQVPITASVSTGTPAPAQGTGLSSPPPAAASSSQTSPPKAPASPLSVKVPILYYHSINETPFGLEILSVRASEFEKQIKYLAENGYTSIYLNEDPSVHKKPVAITLDDGYIDNFQYAYPILEKYGMKATIFVSTDVIGTPGYLSLAQIRSMTKRISFQSHGLSHTPLIELDEDQIRKELTESKRIIESITGRAVYAFCYPYGDYDKMVLSLTASYYSCAVTINSGVATKILGNYLTVRVFVSRYDTLENLLSKMGA